MRLFSNPSLKSLAPLLLKNKGTKGVRFTNDLDGLSPPGQAATMPKAVAYRFILYETQGNIARLVLNRPALNTWDYPGQGGIADEFYSALAQAAEDDQVKAVIIKGAGRVFSAGHDFATGDIYRQAPETGARRVAQRTRLRINRRWVEAHQSLLYFPKVTIAAVHGYCMGEGLAVALACDILLVAEDCQIGPAEQRLGAGGAGIGYIPILMLSVGLKRAREMLLQGRLLSGREAERAGLAARCVPAEKLDEEAENLARAVCLLPRDGLAIGKAMTHLVYDRLGLSRGFILGYLGTALFTNAVYEEDEYNFYRERRHQGVKAAITRRESRYQGLEGLGKESQDDRPKVQADNP